MRHSLLRGRASAIPALLGLLATIFVLGAACIQPAQAQRNAYKTHHQFAFVNNTPYKVMEFWVTDGKKNGYDVDFLAAIDVEPGKWSTQDFMIPVSQPCFLTVEVGIWDPAKGKKQYAMYKNQNVCIGQRFSLDYRASDDLILLSIE